MNLPLPSEDDVERVGALFGRAIDHCSEASSNLSGDSTKLAVNAIALATHATQAELVYGPVGGITDPLAAEVIHRQQMFGLEWLLRLSTDWTGDADLSMADIRSLYAPDLRPGTFELLTECTKLAQFRDALMTFERGGYEATIEADQARFTDPLCWPGLRDYICTKVSTQLTAARARRLASLSTDPGEITLLLQKDCFPYDIDAAGIRGESLWALWAALVRWVERWYADFQRDLKAGRPRGPADYIVLSEFSDLAELLSETSTASDDEAERFVDLLKFTPGTQRKFTLFHKPLIGITETVFALHPMTVIGARPGPTLRRVLIASDSRGYDECSGRTEKATCSRISGLLDGALHRAEPNVLHPWVSTPGEIDIVAFEYETKELWLVQIKDIVYPDTVPEVVEANDDVIVGQQQLQREHDAVEAEGVRPLLERLGIHQEGDVHVRYLLSLRGFIGSDYLEYPEWLDVLPVEHLEQCLGPRTGLSQVVRAFTSLYEQLAAEAPDRTASMPIEIGPITFDVPGVVEIE